MTTPAPLPDDHSDTERDAMLAELREAWAGSMTPPELRQACLDVVEGHGPNVTELRMILLVTLGVWIRQGVAAGLDLHVLEQVAAAEMLTATAMLMRAAKERRGEPYVPARQAICAWAMAKNIAAAEPFRADIYAAAETWEAGQRSEEATAPATAGQEASP